VFIKVISRNALAAVNNTNKPETKSDDKREQLKESGKSAERASAMYYNFEDVINSSPYVPPSWNYDIGDL
jgi:hypothetical protein